MRLIDLELRTETVWISCPYDARVVATIKTIPGREYDNDTKRWSVPLNSIADVVQRLDPLHFQFTPRMRDWWLEHRDEAAVSAEEKESVDEFDVDPSDGYTISRLNEAARRALAETFGDEVWVVAELDGYDRNKSGHAYFELIERISTGGEAIARIGAVLFAKTRRQIERELGDDLALADGLVARLRGRVDIYAAGGRYQFIVEAVDAEWSVGAMRRLRDQVLEQLEKRDLLERNLSLPLPPCPLRIGVITSVESDAYSDFVHELERSHFAFQVTAHDARMQGRNTASSVTTALRWFAERADAYDVVVITRGGGSRSDLSFFDSLEIGEAVCRHPLKIIAGIGHHRDRSVLDFVAHSEKTPTAAAQLLVGRVAETMETVDRQIGRLSDVVDRRVEGATRRLDVAANALQRTVTERMRASERRVERAVAGVSSGARDALAAAATRLDDVTISLERAAMRRTTDAARRVDLAASRLHADAFARRARRKEGRLDDLERRLRRAADATIDARRLRVEHLQAKLRLSDPRRILERGFAIVREPGGRIVTRADQVRELSTARLQMRDGTLEIEPKENVDE